MIILSGTGIKHGDCRQGIEFLFALDQTMGGHRGLPNQKAIALEINLNKILLDHWI
jgi:hypothetical protein